MNRVILVGRLTRDPELRSLPSGKHVATFTVATSEFRGSAGERTEYHPCVSWDRLAEVIGQFLTKGMLVSLDGRLQTRQWDDDAGKRHWKTEVVVENLAILTGRSKKEAAELMASPLVATANPADLARNPQVVKAVLETLIPA